MRKKILIFSLIALLSFGAVAVVYADNNSYGFYGYRGGMMSGYNNSNHNRMIEALRSNGFEAAAKAMESGDYAAMRDFMNNLNDEQYNQLRQIMRQNGCGGAGSMMSSIGRNR